jgi:hypothetical protein
MLPQVEPIDDLDRLWGAVPNPFGREPTPITADDLDTRVRLQPLRDRWGRATGEQIHHLMALEITDHGPNASPSPPGPCVEPDHLWGRKSGTGGTMEQTHNRPVTPRYAQGGHEPCAGTTANCDAHLTEG